MYHYEQWTVNRFVRAQLLSGRPYTTYYLEVNIHEDARQTEHYIDMGMRAKGWQRSTTEAGPVNGWKIIWYTKIGSGPGLRWTDEERGEYLAEAMDVLHTLNIGPVAVRFLG